MNTSGIDSTTATDTASEAEALRLDAIARHEDGDDAGAAEDFTHAAALHFTAAKLFTRFHAPAVARFQLQRARSALDSADDCLAAAIG